MSLGAVLGLIGFVGLLLWLVRRGEEAGTGRACRARRSQDVDREVLEAAEREVRDLGREVSPEDGFVGDDWGPGAPRP
jgi:hypothetical protein